MENHKKNSKWFAAGMAMLFLMFNAVPSSQASLESIRGFSDQVLDGIENVVISSGLVDAKKSLWEKYGILIKPFLKTRYSLTSNVFLAPDDDSDHTDNIWSITPGLQWLWKNKWGVVGGAYEATFKYYSQFSEQNTQDQSFLVYANLFPTENTYIRISEKLDQQGAVAGSSAFEPVDYLDNRFNVAIGYRMEDWTFEFGYENFDRDFQSTIAERFSYNEDKYDLHVYYQLTPKTRVFTGVRLGQVDFWKNEVRDSFYWELPIGVETELPFEVNARASVGVHHRNVESDLTNDITHVVTNISLQRNFNQKKTSVELGFLRRPVEGAFSTAGVYDEKLWYGAIKHLITPVLRGRFNVYQGNRDFEDRVFTGTRVVVGGTVFAVGGAQMKRDDSIVGTGIGFDYNVRKWLILHMDYQYSRRDSNISAFDYTENVFSLGSTIPL